MARASGLLTKNTKLSYSNDGTVWTDLGEDLQEFPDLGAAADQVEVTTLADSNRRYINGIKDFGSLEFTFLYDGATEGSFKKLQAIEKAGQAVKWKVTLPDNVDVTFEGMASVALSGAGVNDALTFKLSINLSSDVTFGE